MSTTSAPMDMPSTHPPPPPHTHTHLIQRPPQHVLQRVELAVTQRVRPRHQRHRVLACRRARAGADAWEVGKPVDGRLRGEMQPPGRSGGSAAAHATTARTCQPQLEWVVKPQAGRQRLGHCVVRVSLQQLQLHAATTVAILALQAGSHRQSDEHRAHVAKVSCVPTEQQPSARIVASLSSTSLQSIALQLESCAPAPRCHPAA